MPIVFSKRPIIENIDEKRNYLVVKSNELVQKGRFSLSLAEQKIFASIISKIKQEDRSLRVYSFSVIEFCKICGIDYNNGKNYINIKKTLKNMVDKSIWIKLNHFDGEKETILRIIQRVYINNKTGIIEIELDELLKNYLINLQNNFTVYNLIYILPMKSKYSPRIYEILKSYSNQNYIRISLDNLKDLLMIEKNKYLVWSDFKKRVLNRSLDEINKTTDLNISYKTITKNRRVQNISFVINKKGISELINIWDENKKILED